GVGNRRIAILYGVNTAGAALGCFLTDFLLVPTAGLRGAQVLAVLFNIVAAAGAFGLASRATPARVKKSVAPAVAMPPADAAVVSTSLALGLSGFAAMGMEILWFRHL